MLKKKEFIGLTAGFMICIFLAGCADLERINIPESELQAVKGGKGGSSVKDPCPDCGKSLAYAEEYKLWFCEKEGKYMAEGFDPAKAAKKFPTPPAKKFPVPAAAAKKFPTPASKKATVENPCPDCGKSLAYAEEFKLWFCEGEQKYMPEGYNPAAAQPAAAVAAPVAVVPAVAAPVITPKASAGGVLVFGFEDTEGTEASENQNCDYSLSSEYVTQGNKCFKAEHGNSAYPGFVVFEFEKNVFSGYKYLVVDVYNPGPQIKNFAFTFDNDKNYGNGRYTMDDMVLKPGANTIKLDLTRARSKLKEGPEEVGLALFFMDAANDSSVTYPFTLYYDNLRLEN